MKPFLAGAFLLLLLLGLVSSCRSPEPNEKTVSVSLDERPAAPREELSAEPRFPSPESVASALSPLGYPVGRWEGFSDGRWAATVRRRWPAPDRKLPPSDVILLVDSTRPDRVESVELEALIANPAVQAVQMRAEFLRAVPLVFSALELPVPDGLLSAISREKPFSDSTPEAEVEFLRRNLGRIYSLHLAILPRSLPAPTRN